MSRKIWLSGIGMTFLVIIIGLISIGSVSSNNIGAVKDFNVVKVTDNSAELKWKKVGSADGYIVYAKTGKEEKKIKTIKDSSKTEYIAKNLEDSTNYEFYALAYKVKGKKKIVSAEYTSTNVFTNPLAQSSNITITGEGKMLINWLENSKANGYVIQYSNSKNFSDSKEIVVEDSSVIEKEITDLPIGETFYVRVRSYAESNDDKYFGEWSKSTEAKILSKIELSRIDPSKPMIAITFDDGPGYNGASDRILKVLEKYNIRATFFMLGKNALNNKSNVKRKVELGCEIGNHTYNHEHYGKNVTEADIKKASDAIYKACGQYPTAFRSPGGNTTEKIRTECKNENMPLYYWSLDTQDWKSRDADKVYNKVMKNVSDGDIILMHEIYDSTAEAFERMVPELIKKGYQFVTCEELIEAKTGKKAQAGTQYLDGTTIKNKTS